MGWVTFWAGIVAEMPWKMPAFLIGNCPSPVVRVGHGYGKTRGFGVTGVTGTGTGWAFGNPRHTATRTRGITGIHRYIATRCA